MGKALVEVPRDIGKRNLRASVGAIAVVGALLAGGGAAGAPRAATQAERGEVTIKRDSYGVPHVYAGTAFGVFYGYGYALAQDHMFALDMYRRTAMGTVAAALGPDYVETDKTSRTLFDQQLLRRQYESLKPGDRGIYEAYAAGFNAYLDKIAPTPGLLPREYAQYGVRPLPLTGFEAAMTHVRQLAINYGGQSQELDNLSLLLELRALHGPANAKAVFEQIRWLNDSGAPTTISASEQNAASPNTFPSEARLDDVLYDRPQPSSCDTAVLRPVSPLAARRDEEFRIAQFGGPSVDDLPKASNVWVLNKTADGSAILYNGPQVNNFAGSYISSVGLHGGGFDVVGSAILGSPWLQFGTNGEIGWGVTYDVGDVVDTYQLQLDPRDRYRYLYNCAYVPMKRRVEVIEVKGGPSISHEVFESVHGTVRVFDEANGVAYAQKRSWDQQAMDTHIAYIDSMKAKSFDQFRSITNRVGIVFNYYYADRKGNIGYLFLGKFPKRPLGQDFRLPAVGTGIMEWQGFLKPSDNPFVYNPKQKYIANWNNKPQPNYNNSDFSYWGALDHTAYLEDVLSSQPTFTPEEAWEINRVASFRNVNATFFVPLIAEATSNLPPTNELRQISARLTSWDHWMVSPTEVGGDFRKPPLKWTAEGTIIQAFVEKLTQLVLEGQVPERLLSPRQQVAHYVSFTWANPSTATKIAYNALLGREAGVPQKYDFLKGRSRDAVVRDALQATIADLKQEFGPEPASWRAQAAPHVFRTTNYAGVPVASKSAEMTLPAAMSRGTQSHMIVMGPKGVRYCDVTPPGVSGFVSATGQKSPHYDDQMALYWNLACHDEHLTEAAVNADLKSTTRLKF